MYRHLQGAKQELYLKVFIFRFRLIYTVQIFKGTQHVLPFTTIQMHALSDSKRELVIKYKNIPRVYKTFHAPPLSITFIMLIHVKMPTIVGILTFISMINTPAASLKARKALKFQHFSFYEQLKVHAQLSLAL